MIMPVDRRSPGTYIVDEFLPVSGGQVATIRLFSKKRRASNGAKRTNRRIDSPRDEFLCFFKKSF